MSIQAAFDKFHAENPEVFEAMITYARALRRAGHERLSIALLAERVRWDRLISTTGDQYKLNNNFKAVYVRLLDEMPEFKGRFTLRTRKTS